MAVDRGSLDYRIKVGDQFSAPIKRFRADILKAISTVRLMKAELASLGQGASLGTTGVRNYKAETERATSATKKLTDEERAHWKEVKDGAATAEKARRLRSRARADEQREQARLQREETKALRDSEKAADKARKDSERATKRQAAEIEKARRAQERLTRETRRTHTAGNQLLGTFKRLAGVFVGFQAIRLGARAFSEAVQAGVRFNSTIEDNRIGLAAMYTTLRDIRAIQSGDILQGGDAFNASLGIADDTLEKIRNRSLATAATFPELAEAFRAAFASGSAAGLDTDEILLVSERFSQILTSQGIAQNQINEEIRSFLGGVATDRTSVIPRLFFGGAANSNRIVREAKKVGNLFPLIEKQLRSFSRAAALAQRTFTGTFARLRGALEFAAGQGGLPFFNNVKQGFQDIIDLVAVSKTDASGFITSLEIKPQAITLIGQASSTLSNLVTLVREFITSLSGREVGNALVVVGAAAEVFFGVLLNLFTGIVRGLSIIGTLMSAFGVDLNNVNGGPLTTIATTIGTIGVLLVSARVGMAAFGFATATVVRIWKGFNKALILTQTILTFSGGILAKGFGVVVRSVGAALLLIGRIPGALFTAAGAVGLLVLAFSQLASSILGINLEIQDIPSVIGNLFETLGTKSIAYFRNLASQFKNFLIVGFLEFVDQGTKALDEVQDFYLSVFGSPERREEFADQRGIADRERFLELQRAREESARKEKELAQELAQVLKDADKRAGDRVLKLEEEVQKREAIRAKVEAYAQASKDAAGADQGLLSNIVEKLSTLTASVLDGSIVDQDAIAADILASVQKAQKTAADQAKKGDAKFEDGFFSFDTKKFEEGVDKAFTSAADKYRSLIQTMKSATDEFANYISAEIVIALDPDSAPEGETASDRFKKFLRAIGVLIIQELVKLAIAKAILNIAGGGGVASGGQASLAKGGMVLGFDEGGTVPGGAFEAPKFRPASVAASDTVPAWLTPGEFVTPVNRVMQYGADLLEGIRRGALNPAALREAAGLTNRRKSVKKVRARGYVDGGAVGSSISTQLNAAEARQSRNNDAPVAIPAIVASNDRQMDRLTAGGARALRNWAQSESAFFRGIVQSDSSGSPS